MGAWGVNAVAQFVVFSLIFALGLGLLWRIGSWRVPQVASLVLDEGLPIGSEAPDVAAHSHDQDFHLSFQHGRRSFVVFGTRGCKPCLELLEAAANHPATRDLRLVYVSDSDDVDVSPDVLPRWETYRFHDEKRSRELWQAPVSPYFHVVDSTGRVVEKGIANHASHLDRLLHLPPSGSGWRALPGRHTNVEPSA